RSSGMTLLLRQWGLVVLGLVQELGELCGGYREAEEDSGDDRCRGKVIPEERESGYVAGSEAGGGVRVHGAEDPDGEVREDVEAGGRGEDSGGYAEEAGLAQQGAAGEADETVP